MCRWLGYAGDEGRAARAKVMWMVMLLMHSAAAVSIYMSCVSVWEGDDG